MLNSLDVDVPLADKSPLTVQLRVQIGVLALTLVVDAALLVDLGPQVLYETDVAIDTRLKVLVHSSLFFVQAAKVLLLVE